MQEKQTDNKRDSGNWTIDHGLRKLSVSIQMGRYDNG